MKNAIPFLSTLAFFICLGGNSLAQSRFKMEFYGGPQYSYQKPTTIQGVPLNMDVGIDYHLGLNFLLGIGKDLQLSFQSEMIRPNLKFDYYLAYPDLSPRLEVKRVDSFGNYRLGLRKSWENGKHGFFVQPSLGFTVNNYWDFPRADTVAFVYAEKATKIVGNVALEAGMKFYTKRKNYLMVGVRHQFGLSPLNPSSINNYAGISEASVQRRGTYTGLFVGYGIDFKGRTKEERLEERLGKEAQKLEKREMAWGNGPYVMANGLLRFRPKSEREPNLEFSHISGGYELLAGYTLGSFSLESGYSKFNAYTGTTRPNGFSIQTNTNFNVSAIPVRLRYHIDLGENKRIRVGASLAAFYTLQTRGLGQSVRGGVGNVGGNTYSLTYTPINESSQGKVFFNAGVFAEVSIFNSSMLTFNFSRNFGSPEVGKVNVTGTINGEPVNYVTSGSLDGWIMEVGYKLPLNVLFK
ncbi:hypothetical protein [Algoriphagus litoralis]|uniref:hypothetical protein n=1 Tax=Algoriphagus litoralis TaxID=2202829 RepID=UPI000DB9F67A|nr:hypothetical protein [Algoriphagus litoralis]